MSKVLKIATAIALAALIAIIYYRVIFEGASIDGVQEQWQTLLDNLSQKH